MKFQRGGIFLLILCTVVQLWGVTMATLSKSDKGKKKKKDKEVILSVFDRGLVTKDLKKKHITEEHSKFSPLEQDVKNFKGPVLGYVTPWNNHGYDVAKMFGAKFTHISPVWLQIKRMPGGGFFMEGGHDIDKGWVNDVARGGAVSIVPRVLFDGWRYEDFMAIFNSEDAMEDCINVLVDYIKEKEFAGVVIEVWAQLGGSMKKQLVHLLTHLSEALHEAKKTFILVVPPAVQSDGSKGMFLAEDFKSLVDKVDFFSVMTYDYSTSGMPGPNSPLSWMRKCVEALCPTKEHRNKTLMGLNFYGAHFIVGTKVEAILGPQFVDVIKNQKPKIHWDADVEEHIVEIETGMNKHYLYYPTLYSLHLRLKLATELGVGIAIWEIGQGLDYFYDLL